MDFRTTTGWTSFYWWLSARTNARTNARFRKSWKILKVMFFVFDFLFFDKKIGQLILSSPISLEEWLDDEIRYHNHIPGDVVAQLLTPEPNHRLLLLAPALRLHNCTETGVWYIHLGKRVLRDHTTCGQVIHHKNSSSQFMVVFVKHEMCIRHMRFPLQAKLAQFLPLVHEWISVFLLLPLSSLKVDLVDLANMKSNLCGSCRICCMDLKVVKSIVQQGHGPLSAFPWQQERGGSEGIWVNHGLKEPDPGSADSWYIPTALFPGEIAKLGRFHKKMWWESCCYSS